MLCPFCNHTEDRVMDSRESAEGDSIRRRRECTHCQRRFTTYERIEEYPLRVIKKDGRRENYQRAKLFSGLSKACEKRPISEKDIDHIIDAIEQEIERYPDQEIATTQLGELVMNHLKTLDPVAYVRFASVYRDFKDVTGFTDEIRNLLEQVNQYKEQTQHNRAGF